MANELTTRNNVPAASRSADILPHPAKHERFMTDLAEIRGRLSTAIHDSDLAALDRIVAELEPMQRGLDALRSPATIGNITLFVRQVANLWPSGQIDKAEYCKFLAELVGEIKPLLISLQETLKQMGRDPEHKFLPSTGIVLCELKEVDRFIRNSAGVADYAREWRDKIAGYIEAQAEQDAKAKAYAEACRREIEENRRIKF